MRRSRFEDPVHVVFLAGFSWALAATEVFALRYTGDSAWRLNLVMACLAFSFGLVLAVFAIILAVRQGRRILTTIGLASYWAVALLGLLVLAFADDPVPFLSTLVASILSVMVAWLVQTYILPSTVALPREPALDGEAGSGSNRCPCFVKRSNRMHASWCAGSPMVQPGFETDDERNARLQREATAAAFGRFIEKHGGKVLLGAAALGLLSVILGSRR